MREGALAGGAACLEFGTGSPLVVFRSVLPDSANPSGAARWAELRSLKSLSTRFTVLTVGRRPGLKPGVTMAELATHHAEELRARFDRPTDLLAAGRYRAAAMTLAPTAADSRPGRTLMAMLQAEDAFDIEDRLAEITAPTLVIAGARDALYPPELAGQVAGGVRDGKLKVYERRRHHTVMTDRRFSGDVIDFLTPPDAG